MLFTLRLTRSTSAHAFFFETFDSAEKLLGHATQGANRLTCADACKNGRRSRRAGGK